MTKYAAKLLFQFRVKVAGTSGKRRLCEERIINFNARSPQDAVRVAKLYGHQGQHRYDNSDGNEVSFEFVGIMDLVVLGSEVAEGEVWYDIRERLMPMERRAQILPSERDLLGQLARLRR
jgi:hypothetical protein